MYLDLTDVMRAPGNSTEKPIDIAPVTLDDIEVVEPIRGWVRASNARQNVVVSGHAETAVNMECARCLRPYPQHVELELEASAPVSFFRSLLTGQQPDDEEDEADDELAALFDENSLDVLELIRQAIVLQSPRKPLCSPDCPGLPEASQYMNAGEDERWQALSNWKQQEEKEN